MNAKETNPVVLAVYPTSRGLGYAVFDSPRRLLDWGGSDIRINKTARTLNKLNVLIDLYQPDVLVLEDSSAGKPQRAMRIRKLISRITSFALDHEVPVKHYTPQQVGQVFQCNNKDARARDISRLIPELEPYRPPTRRTFDNRHERMQIFDAVSLALTYYYLET